MLRLPAPELARWTVLLLFGLVACGRVGLELTSAGPGPSAADASCVERNGRLACGQIDDCSVRSDLDRPPASAAGLGDVCIHEGADIPVSDSGLLSTVAFDASGSVDNSSLGPARDAAGVSDAGALATDGPETKCLFDPAQLPLPPCACGPSSAALVARYPFDDGSGAIARDATVGARHGSLTNMNAQNWVVGHASGALQFDGVDDYVSVGNVSDRVRTLSLWLKAAPLTLDRAQNVLKVNGTAQLELRGAEVHALDFPAGSVVYVDGQVGSSIDTQFRHVVISWPSDLAFSALEIGGHSGEPEYYGGLIDDVRLYAAQLTAAQISGLFSNSACGT